jgi:hypothetical protein
MIVLAYLGTQCTAFHTTGWTCWFLRSFIWSLYESNSECASNLLRILEESEGDPGNKLTSFRRRKGKAKLTENEKGETGEGQKSRACSSLSLTSRRSFTRNSSWQDKQFRIRLAWVRERTIPSDRRLSAKLVPTFTEGVAWSGKYAVEIGQHGSREYPTKLALIREFPGNMGYFATLKVLDVAGICYILCFCWI